MAKQNKTQKSSFVSRTVQWLKEFQIAEYLNVFG